MRFAHVLKKAFAHAKAFCVIHFAKINSLNYGHCRQDSPQVNQFTSGISCLKIKFYLPVEDCISPTCCNERMQHVRDAFQCCPQKSTYRDSRDVNFPQTAVLMCCPRAFTFESCEVSLLTGIKTR
jgi:hypothetical protein